MSYIMSAYSCFTPGKTLAEKFDNAVKNGFTAMEIDTLRDDTTRKEALRAANNSGIKIHGVMNNDHWPYPLSRPEVDIRQKSITGIIQAMDTAVLTGADSILVVPGIVQQDVSDEEAWKWSTDSISRIIPEADTRGLTILLENCNAKFLYSARDFIDFIDQFKTSSVSGYFDVGNVCAYGYPNHWIKVLDKRIKKLHFKGYHDWDGFCQLLHGHQDWQIIMQSLREIDFSGYITSEVSCDTLSEYVKMSREFDQVLRM